MPLVKFNSFNYGKYTNPIKLISHTLYEFIYQVVKLFIRYC